MSYQSDVIGNPKTSAAKNTEGRAFVATTRAIRLGSIDSGNSIDPELAKTVAAAQTFSDLDDRFLAFPSGSY